MPLSRPRGHSRDYGLCGSRRNSRHWAHRESKTRYLARLHEETDEENGTAPIRRFDGDVTSRGLDRLLEGGHGRAPRKGSVHRTQSSGDGFDAALAVNFRCSRWTKVFTKQCLALGVALWVPRSRWLLDWWREQQTAYPWIATPVARHDAPSRCPNCGFASLFLYPFLLSRMRVGVWDTSTLFVQVDFSKAGRWHMAGEPPFFRQRSGRTVRHFPTAAPAPA